MRMRVRKCIEISRWSSGVAKSRGRTFKPSSKPPFDPLSLWRKSRSGKILQSPDHSVPKMFGPDVEVVGGGSHHRLGLHHHPWHPSLGSNINHADHTVITTSGSTHSQKLLLCKLDKDQILAHIEMKTEIWVPFLLQSLSRPPWSSTWRAC